MLHVLIGHRGTGKTAFLHRIAGYYREAGRPIVALDLDEVIAERAGEPVFALFSRLSEAGFRELEDAVFRSLIDEHHGSDLAVDIYIAVGAGFLGTLPPFANVVWIRRPTDALGRVFVGSGAHRRPRLNPAVRPLVEYKERFLPRESRCAAAHREIWTLLEGQEHPSEFEKEWVFHVLSAQGPSSPRGPSLGGVLSLLPANFRGQGHNLDFSAWIGRRLVWPKTCFELRDDLLGDPELAQALAEIPPSRRIYSFRRAAPTAETLRRVAADGGVFDYPMELGLRDVPAAPPILSLHQREAGESLPAAAERLSRAGADLGAGLVKLAVEVRDFAELAAGWDWSQAAPGQRVFLPRSDSARAGRWRWFRLLTGPSAPLAFFREGEGTSADQPLLQEWLRRVALPAQSCTRFAAVLGDPVAHSRSPMEHDEYFRARGIPMLAVPINQAEWEQGALSFLRRLGLRYAAVTAPLKGAAAALLRSPESRDPEAINTLYYCEKTACFSGANTDVMGARALLLSLQEEAAVAVWGGGGTRPSVRAVLPQARFFSARTGAALDAAAESGWQPTSVVFAAPPTRCSTWPDPAWSPRRVVDLNYSEDSPGREYALQVGAEYSSGLAMFRAQAAGQRAFWSEEEVRNQEP
jgi:shikimate 5-dehydrogenase/shikimate kinase